MLEKLGYAVIQADGGADALKRKDAMSALGRFVLRPYTIGALAARLREILRGRLPGPTPSRACASTRTRRRGAR
jgi:hypothetical protein